MEDLGKTVSVRIGERKLIFEKLVRQRRRAGSAGGAARERRADLLPSVGFFSFSE